MKRTALMILVIIFTTSLVGCSISKEEQIPKEDNFVMVGTIVSIEGKSILLVEEATHEDIKNLSPKEIINKYNDGAWFKFDTMPQERLNIGDKVKVWFDALDTSLPAYGHPTKIQVLN